MNEQHAKAKLLEIAHRVKDEQYRKPCLGNEQATKKWLIEPIFIALGWDVDSPDVYPEDEGGVGSKADYGLRINNKVLIFVEAKSLGKALDDKDAAQTSNYANNKGVAWCALTNGNIWRVYRSSGAALSERLLFEIEIEADNEKIDSAWQRLRYLSRTNVQSGELDKFANKIFIDNRLRDVVKHLLHEPTQKFINVLKEDLAGFSTEQIKEALKRFNLGDLTGDSTLQFAPHAIQTPIESNSVVATIKKTNYSEEYHLKDKPQHTKHLFYELQKVILETSTSNNVDILYKKQTIAFKSAKKYLADVEIQRGKLKLNLSLNPEEVVHLPNNARDVSRIGHWGTGDLQFSISSAEDIALAVPFISLARIKAHE